MKDFILSAAGSVPAPDDARPASTGTSSRSNPPHRSPALGVFGVGERLVAATRAGASEVRLDIIGEGGRAVGPLGVVRGVDRPELFLDAVHREWADEPGISWHLRRWVVERIGVEPRPMNCPDALPSEWSRAADRVHPLGVLTTRAETIALTLGEPGVVWLDRLGATGSVDAPIGVVTGADTAIPRLYLDMAVRSWAGEPPMAWHLTRTAVDRYWTTTMDAARVCLADDGGNGDDAEALDGAGIGSLLMDRCRVDDIDADHERWHGPGPHRRSAAHAIDGGDRS